MDLDKGNNDVNELNLKIENMEKVINKKDNDINVLNTKINDMEKDITSIKNFITSLNTKIENLEKELSIKNDIIKNNSKSEGTENKITEKSTDTGELQSKVDNIENENSNNNIIELKSKIENLEKENKNNINMINIKINELQNNEVNSLKYSILTKVRSKAVEDYLKLKLKNRSIKTRFLKIQYANEINQLINANKILYFRKFANIILDEIDKKIGRNKKKTSNTFTNIFNPGIYFPIIYVENDIGGVKSSKITAIIDYFYFIKEECSNIIHLKKEKYIKEDIYLNHLIMMENQLKNLGKEYMQRFREFNEKSNNEKNLNNINTEEKKDDDDEEKNKNYSLNELCTFLFTETNIDDNKLIQNNIDKQNPESESISTSLMLMKDSSSPNISNTEKQENLNDENNKVHIEKFYNYVDNEILFDELTNFIQKSNDELINKKIGFKQEKIMLDLIYLQGKINKVKQKIKEKEKNPLKNEIQQINSQYFF